MHNAHGAQFYKLEKLNLKNKKTQYLSKSPVEKIFGDCTLHAQLPDDSLFYNC